MAEFDELQLDKPAPPPPPPQPRWLLILAAVVLVIALIAVWYYLRREADIGSPDSVGVTQEVVPQTGAPPSTDADLPPLDESDTLVRQLVRALSAHPVTAAWLTTDQLIRNFTVSVANVAGGNTPAGHLHTIAPGRPFQIQRQRGITSIDPASYARFDGHAAAVDGLDPSGVAALYRRLKPRIEEAYRELAGPTADFDRTLQRAIVNVLETPIVEGPIEVRPATVGYDYADPSLQSLSRAQQQLLRMGPQNARRIQQKLRAIALELGMPEASLPRERIIRSAS